jgi:tRNA pseudouridine65 synthase
MVNEQKSSLHDKIVYQDDYCLVVSKPSNQIIHHSYFARNIDELSLVDELRQNGFPNASPVHRLDRKTSGLILFATESNYVIDFQALFDSDSIQKTYIALVRGWPSEQGIINSPVKNERGNYKEALTSYKLLKKVERAFDIPPYPSQRYSLIEFEPKTGRYHQLRIHANKIGHPIINDPKHGNRHHNHYFQEKLSLHDLYLHANKLCFTHPFSNKKVSLSLPLPAHFETFLRIS